MAQVDETCVLIIILNNIWVQDKAEEEDDVCSGGRLFVIEP